MRVNFFSVPVLTLATSLTVACSGSDGTNKTASELGPGGIPGSTLGTGGSTTTPVGTGTPPTSTSTGGTSTVTTFPTTTGTGAAPSSTGGVSSSTGGVSSSTGGASSSTGGASSSTGGASSSTGGASGAAGSTGTAGAAGSGSMLHGMCCQDGNCLCHGDDPMGMPTSKNGPYKTATLTMMTGTVYYPTDADPPLAAVSICPGFLNTGPEMAPWGPFYASWGIICVVTTTGAADLPQIRGNELVAAINELKKQGTTSSSPLNGKLAGRYGTSGYSMGGGGTTFASEADPTMKTSVGLAAWGPDGPTVKTPTLFICSDADTVASCTGTNSSYAAIPSPTPKMILNIPGESHFNWFSPTDAGMGESGAYALAFQKVYLEGDTRWMAVLKSKPKTGTTQMANIQ